MVTNTGGITNKGSIIRVRGSVVDISFSKCLPEIDSKLEIDLKQFNGDNSLVIFEVVSHLDDKTVRCLALNPTQGIARGQRVLDTGEPLMVPVGEAFLGRMLNVFGDTIDFKPRVEGEARKSIHKKNIPLSNYVVAP